VSHGAVVRGTGSRGGAARVKLRVNVSGECQKGLLTEKVNREIGRLRTWREVGDSEEVERCNTRINDIFDQIDGAKEQG
jgi:hypothetical protein